jgi:hypothetical protein
MGVVNREMDPTAFFTVETTVNNHLSNISEVPELD